jgi:outer membrane lipoprotein carrier protein
VSSVTADFEQTYLGPGVVQTEAGVLYMKKPGLMCWEYRKPEVKLFVADGRNSYLYTPEDRQVMVGRLSAAELRSTPLQFLLGRGRIMESFVVSWESELKPRVEGTILLRLVPRTPEPSYAYVVLECDESTYDLRRVVIREATGNTSEFLLTNLQTNVRVDDRKFQFKIPKGVEVIHLDER